MLKIGTVQQVQIQPKPLKTGVEPNRVYNPEPIQVVDKLQLTADGIIGLTVSGKEIIDAHHVNHPVTRNNGSNGISIGFVQHYEVMRKRFGQHLTDGIAGENILVDAEVDIAQFQQSSHYFIQHDEQMIELIEVAPMSPCRPFSEFCLIVPQCQEDIKAALQFLSNGIRGYKALVAASDESYFVQAGDTLWVE